MTASAEAVGVPALDDSPHLLLVSNRSGRIHLLGRALAGLDARAHSGLPASAVFAPDSRASVEAALAAALAGEPLDVVEDVALSADGRPFRLRLEPLRDGDGAVVAICVLAENSGPPAPDPERLADIARAQRREAIGQLALGIAHDFGNLISVVGGAAEALSRARAVAADPETLEDLAAIRGASTRAATLVRQLLALGGGAERRPGTLELDPALVDLGALLRRLWHSRARLVLDLGAPGHSVRADATEFDQVILNLAMNARDAMLDGGTLTIRTRAVGGPPGGTDAETLGAGTLTLELIDTGIGIAPDVLPHIFDPFFTTKRTRGGTGLGLATVATLLRAAGARIDVESTVGLGTRFRIAFPQASVCERAGVSGISSRLQASPHPERTPPTGGMGAVLLVDDDDLVRRLASRALSRRGWEVLSAASGEAAMALLTAHAGGIRALVTDIAMPGMDGREVIVAVRQALGAPDLPVIVASGYRDSAGQPSAPEAAPTATLEKPYLPSRLVEMLDAILEPQG